MFYFVFFRYMFLFLLSATIVKYTCTSRGRGPPVTRLFSPNSSISNSSHALASSLSRLAKNGNCHLRFARQPSRNRKAKKLCNIFGPIVLVIAGKQHTTLYKLHRGGTCWACCAVITTNPKQVQLYKSWHF